MVKSIEDTSAEYKDRIEAVRELERDLLTENVTIKKEDDFELGSVWHLSDEVSGDVTFEWNVPYYLVLTIRGKKVVDEDYIKSDQDWRDVIENSKSLIFSELKK